MADTELIALAKLIRKELDDQKKATQKILRQDMLSAEELLELIDIFPDWAPGEKVEPGDKRKYQGKLYQVNEGQGHTTQSDWTPDKVPALFTEVQAPNVIPEFVQPVGAHDAYAKGDKVTFQGKVYESKIDNNVWSPTAYPAGWTLID